MKKIGMSFLLMTLFYLLSACETTPIQSPSLPLKPLTGHASKKLEYEAMLSDPQIKKDFRALKNVAVQAKLYKTDGKAYFRTDDIKKMDELSQKLINRLENHYHLDAKTHKTHTFIGKNQYDSCYQYYNSLKSETVGQYCKTFSADFATCSECDRYIKAVRTRNKQIIHADWWGGQNTAALVSTFRLKNGDYVYIGLEFNEED